MRRLAGFIRDIAAPALFACWIAYLAYGAVAGSSGYRELGALRADLDDKRAEVSDLRARRETLAQRADLLHPRSLDPDMVDERIRAVLGYAREGDMVVPRDELERLLKAAKAGQ